MTAILSDTQNTEEGEKTQNKAENTKIQFNFSISLSLPSHLYLFAHDEIEHETVEQARESVRQATDSAEENEFSKNVSIKHNNREKKNLLKSQSQNFINFMDHGE